MIDLWPIAHMRNNYYRCTCLNIAIILPARWRWKKEAKNDYLFEMKMVLFCKQNRINLPYDALWYIWLKSDTLYPRMIRFILNWLKVAQWFYRRIFLNFIIIFHYLCNYRPLEKGWALHLNKLESLCSLPNLVKIVLVFWSMRWKYEKVTTTTTTTPMTTTTDKLRSSEKATLAFNSAYLKEINYKYYMNITFFVVAFNQTLGCLRKTPSSVGVLRR